MINTVTASIGPHIFDDLDLTENQYMRVRAINAMGIKSEWSQTLSYTSVFDLDVDSNNDGAIDAQNLDSEDVQEDSAELPGMIIPVSSYLHATDASQSVFNHNTAAITSFYPVLVRIPDLVDVSTAYIRLGYANAPLDGDPGAGGGRLRLWKDNSPLLDASQQVLPAEFYSLNDFVFDPTNRTVTLWVEAARHSNALADAVLTAEIAVIGAYGTEQVIASDTVRLTSFATGIANVQADGTLMPTTDIPLSSPQPAFTGASINLSDVHLPSLHGRELVGQIHIAGTLDDAWSDLIPGNEGRITSIEVLVNGLSIGTAAVDVTKSSGQNVIAAPYDFSGAFQHSFEGVAIGEGLNTVTLVATNSLGDSGTATRGFTVELIPPEDEEAGYRVGFLRLDDGTLMAYLQSRPAGGNWSGWTQLASMEGEEATYAAPGMELELVPGVDVMDPWNETVLSATVTHAATGNDGHHLAFTPDSTGLKAYGNHLYPFHVWHASWTRDEFDLPDMSEFMVSVVDDGPVEATGGGTFTPFVTTIQGPAALKDSFAELVLVGESFGLMSYDDVLVLRDMENPLQIPAVMLSVIASDDSEPGPPHPGEETDWLELALKAHATASAIQKGFVLGVYDALEANVADAANMVVWAGETIVHGLMYYNNFSIGYRLLTQQRIFLAEDAEKMAAGFHKLADVGDLIWELEKDFGSWMKATYTDDAQELQRLGGVYGPAFEQAGVILDLLWEDLKDMEPEEWSRLVGRITGEVAIEVAKTAATGGASVALKSTKIVQAIEKLQKVSNLAPPQHAQKVANALSKAKALQASVGKATAGITNTNARNAADNFFRIVLLKEAKEGERRVWKEFKEVAGDAKLKGRFLETFRKHSDALIEVLWHSYDDAAKKIQQAGGIDKINDPEKLKEILSRVPTWKELDVLTAGERKAVGYEAHHAAVKDLVKRMAANNGVAEPYLDDMPAFLIPVSGHQEFHDRLKIALKGVNMRDNDAVIKALDKTYNSMGPAGSTQSNYSIVSQAWLKSVGLK